MGSVVQDKYEKGCYYVDGQTWQVRVSCLGSRALLTQLVVLSEFTIFRLAGNACHAFLISNTHSRGISSCCVL